MANVFDVAAYILDRAGTMTAMKLQKLVYYSQAWHLAWEEKPMFNEEIQAWSNGPVCPALYEKHRGQLFVSGLGVGDKNKLDAGEKESIDIVLKTYGEKSAWTLSDLTHGEKPWREARAGIPLIETCNNVITHSSMAEFYGSL